MKKGHRHEFTDSDGGREGQWRRHALPNARVMIHQPQGGAQGKASDIDHFMSAEEAAAWGIVDTVL